MYNNKDKELYEINIDKLCYILESGTIYILIPRKGTKTVLYLAPFHGYTRLHICRLTPRKGQRI